ncbi:hypothetical protein [Aureimonas fodinaquatilis]|uniref:hypothetical protein n=1 Tax=Aureimonas fodinaquatilis TaxID=2565783 RepID=UPI001FEC2ABF|nr:hypothetical protein [Aureimonas fodinaquatilis]
MPTLVRLLTALVVIAAIVAATMALLVLYVEPKPTQFRETVPLRELGQGQPTPAPQRQVP